MIDIYEFFPSFSLASLSHFIWEWFCIWEASNLIYLYLLQRKPKNIKPKSKINCNLFKSPTIFDKYFLRPPRLSLHLVISDTIKFGSNIIPLWIRDHKKNCWHLQFWDNLLFWNNIQEWSLSVFLVDKNIHFESNIFSTSVPNSDSLQSVPNNLFNSPLTVTSKFLSLNPLTVTSVPNFGVFPRWNYSLG